MPPEYGQQAVGTHPTGMHSCLKDKFAGIFIQMVFKVNFQKMKENYNFM